MLFLLSFNSLHMRISLNWWAIIVAALAQCVIGWMWYGVFFKEQWMKLSGQKDMKGWAMTMVWGLVVALVMSYVLAYAITFSTAYTHSGALSGGLMSGFFNRLGFIAPVTLCIVLYEKKSWNLWFLINGFWLVTLLVMGGILGMWM